MVNLIPIFLVTLSYDIIFLYALFVSIFVSVWLSSVCWVIMSCLLVAIVSCSHKCCYCLEDTVCSLLVWSYHNHLDMSHRHVFWLNVVFIFWIQLSNGVAFCVWNCDLECLCLSCCVNRLFYSSLFWTFSFYTYLWTVSWLSAFGDIFLTITCY